MKRLINIVFLMVSFLVQAQVTFNAIDLDAIAKAERDANFGKLSPRAIETISNFDVKYYRCRWNINPAIREISGSVTTFFTPTEPGIDSLIFDLHQK